MTDELVETEIFLELRDSNEELVAVLRDEDKVLFIYDGTIKIDLSPLLRVTHKQRGERQ